MNTKAEKPKIFDTKMEKQSKKIAKTLKWKIPMPSSTKANMQNESIAILKGDVVV